MYFFLTDVSIRCLGGERASKLRGVQACKILIENANNTFRYTSVVSIVYMNTIFVLPEM